MNYVAWNYPEVRNYLAWNYLIVRNYLTRDYLIVRNYLAREITDRSSEGASGKTNATNRYHCYVKVQPKWWESPTDLTTNKCEEVVILFYHVWGPAWIEIQWNNIWLRIRSHMTSHYTWGSVTTLHEFGGVLGRPLDTFFWVSHNLMVTALGSCVKWPSNWTWCNPTLYSTSFCGCVMRSKVGRASKSTFGFWLILF